MHAFKKKFTKITLPQEHNSTKKLIISLNSQNVIIKYSSIPPCMSVVLERYFVIDPKVQTRFSQPALLAGYKIRCYLLAGEDVAHGDSSDQNEEKYSKKNKTYGEEDMGSAVLSCRYLPIFLHVRYIAFC